MCDSDEKGREINTIFPIPSGKRFCRLPSENSKRARSFSADESRMASFDRGTGILRVYDTSTGKLIRHIGPVRSTAIEFFSSEPGTAWPCREGDFFRRRLTGRSSASEAADAG